MEEGKEKLIRFVLLQAKKRSLSWWERYFLQINLEENEASSRKFGQASTKNS
jgi:putative pectin methylesterase